MTRRFTGILAAAAIVVLALGLLFGTGNREQQAGVPPSQPAFPGLGAKLAEATRIEITHQGATLALARAGDRWTLPDKGGYPAEPGRVHTLLATLVGLDLAEPRTADPDEYARLGVEDAQAKPKDAGSTLLRVLDASGGAVAQLLVGKPRTGSNGAGDGVYVRRPGEAQAWLAAGHLAPESDPQEWLDRVIADIAFDRIATVTVTHGAQTLRFTREGTAVALTAPPDHAKLDQFKLDDIGRGLEGLTFTDVRPAPAPGTPLGQAVIGTGDGLSVTVTVSKAGADVWAQFAATGDGKAREEAEALQARVKGWAYLVGAEKEAAFVPTLDALKAPPPPPDDPAPPAK